jgi:hypothetical protein
MANYQELWQSHSNTAITPCVTGSGATYAERRAGEEQKCKGLVDFQW